jgi:phosphatidylserine decarboxylase
MTPALREPVLRSLGNRFGVNWAEMPHAVGEFESWQAFFTRGLPAGARPVDASADAIVSPADGAVHSVVTIEQGQLFQIKGRHYTLHEFLGPWSARAAQLEGGTAVTIYLRPRDYHHVHAPVDGAVTDGCVIPGTLWPVNPWANRSVEDLYNRNERVGMRIAINQNGVQNVPYYYFMVGALCVGGIETVFCHRPTQAWEGPLGSPLSKTRGEELGQFLFGSTVIMLYPREARVSFQVDVGQEVRLGQRIGTLGGKRA